MNNSKFCNHAVVKILEFCENAYALLKGTWLIFTYAFISILLLSCREEGCLDPNSINFNPEAEIDDGSCEYSEFEITFENGVKETLPVLTGAELFTLECGNEIEQTLFLGTSGVQIGNDGYLSSPGLSLTFTKPIFRFTEPFSETELEPGDYNLKEPNSFFTNATLSYLSGSGINLLVTGFSFEEGILSITSLPDQEFRINLDLRNNNGGAVSGTFQGRLDPFQSDPNSIDPVDCVNNVISINGESFSANKLMAFPEVLGSSNNSHFLIFATEGISAVPPLLSSLTGVGTALSLKIVHDSSNQFEGSYTKENGSIEKVQLFSNYDFTTQNGSISTIEITEASQIFLGCNTEKHISISLNEIATNQPISGCVVGEIKN